MAYNYLNERFTLNISSIKNVWNFTFIFTNNLLQ